MVDRYTLRVRDLKYPPLRIIPQENLDIAISVSRIFGGEVTPRFKNHKAPITADAGIDRLSLRISKLSDHSIGLSPGRKRDREQSYNCQKKY
jgi:hypothetical protein